MKKKYIKNTYLRNVTDYNISIKKDEENNSYTVIKNIIHTEEPYVSTHTGEDVCLIGDGYYVVEEVPLDKNYLVRAFFDQNKKLKGYYIDIVKESAVEEDGLYYLDLYVDITVDKTSNGEDIVMVWDANELKDALDAGKITLEDFHLAHRELMERFSEIANKENFYMKKCIDDVNNVTF